MHSPGLTTAAARLADEALPRELGQTTVVFVVTAIGLSVTVFDIAFTYGVYDTVFYGRILLVWVIASALLLAHLLAPRGQGFLGARGVVVLLLPSVWLVLRLLDDPALAGQPLDKAILGFGFIVWLIALPYVGYLFVAFTHRDVLDLDPRRLGALVLISAMMGVTGYALGKHNARFLSCEDFTVSGDDAPPGCAKTQGSLLLPGAKPK